ncbi:MAG TPA: hypothetical protein DCG12_09035, partial [Planctomycetaceae bacterium]|nr:hypothetical protein [Planctomycetaceae bacterium]
ADHGAIDGKTATLTFRDVSGFCDALKIGHLSSGIVQLGEPDANFAVLVKSLRQALSPAFYPTLQSVRIQKQLTLSASLFLATLPT